MIILLEMIGRGWENFLARPNSSLSLRFYVQPTMVSLLSTEVKKALKLKAAFSTMLDQMQ